MTEPLAIPPSQPAPDAIASPDASRAWPERFGLAVDRLLNVLFLNGDDSGDSLNRRTWTVSLHAAVARRQGQRWGDRAREGGCVLCAILGALVQRDHCAITLDPMTQETTGAAAKAGALMAVVIAGLWLGVRFFIHSLI